MLLVKRGDLLRDRSFVEAVMHRAQLGLTVARGLTLGLDHSADGAGEVFLFEAAADGRRVSAGTEDRFVLGVTVDPRGMQFYAVAQDRIHVVAIACELHCRGRRLLIGNRAEAAQSLDVRRRRRGDDLAQDAFGHGVAALGFQASEVGRGRPVAESLQAHHPVFALHVDQRRQHAGERNHVGLQDGECDGRCYARIDGVAARIERAHRGRRGEVVSARRRVVAAGDRRAPRDGGGFFLGDWLHSIFTPACFTILANLASATGPPGPPRARSCRW